MNGEGYVFIPVGLLVSWLVCLTVYSQHCRPLHEEISRNDQDRSDTEQEIFWGRLFHAWLDCFSFLKLGPAEVCAIALLPVIYDVIAYSKSRGRWMPKHPCVMLYTLACCSMMAYICVIKLVDNWFKQKLIAFSTLKHFLHLSSVSNSVKTHTNVQGCLS